MNKDGEFYHNHDDLDSADPSSMQDACQNNMNLVTRR